MAGLPTFWLDCKHAIRLYRQTPRASVFAVLVLAVGMAFVSAFLTLYVNLVLRPHPGFEDGGQIATFSHRLPYAAVETVADEMTSIEGAAYVYAVTALIAPAPETEQPLAVLVSEEFFGGLRPRLALGRGFLPEEHAPDAAPVVLSYRYWRERFDGDPSVVGTSIEIARDPARPYDRGALSGRAEPERDSAEFRIVGVMAESMADTPYENIAVWVPIESGYPLLVGSERSLRFDIGGRTYVRRRAGVSLEAVVAEFNARYPDLDRLADLPSGVSFGNNRPLDAITGIVSDFSVYRATKRQLELFLASSLVLAFVAAANVSLHLLARAPGRRRELGIRVAVGAPVRRLARQLATEAGLLVVVAAALGLLVSLWLTALVRSLSFLREADWRDVALLDWRVLGATAGVVLLLTLLVSLAPILGLRRLAVAASAQHTTARASLAQRLAGTAQVAAAGAFGGAAIAFGWFLAPLLFGHPGYETADRYLVWIYTFSDVQAAREREIIEAIPGVSAVAFGTPIPPTGEGSQQDVVQHPEDPATAITFQVGVAERQYVELVGLTLLHGRVFESADTTGVLVNQSLAQALWGRDDVVGEHIPPGSRLGDAAEVVGVLADVPMGHPGGAVAPTAWTRLGTGVRANAVIQTRMTAAQLGQALDPLARTRAIEMPSGGPRSVVSLEARYEELVAPDRARGLLTLAAAAIVVLVAAFGFYGIQRYLVAAGRREYAIRAAVGAAPSALGWLVLRRAVLLGLPGLAVGALLAFAVVAWLRDDYLSRDVSPALTTFWLLGGLTLLLLGVSLGPAAEAGRAQPAELLRAE